MTTFTALKDKIATTMSLIHFDVKNKVTLTCNASKSGLGAACLQQGNIVSSASRAMIETERRYSQIEKEMLAVLFVPDSDTT